MFNGFVPIFLSIPYSVGDSPLIDPKCVKIFLAK